MERPIEPFNGNIVWSTVSMAKTKKSNYAKINIVNVRKALFKNKSNYGCNDALVDNRYIYLFWRTKELMFRASGVYELTIKETQMNFSQKWTTENWYENIDWMVFLAISLALIALEEARPVLIVQ